MCSGTECLQKKDQAAISSAQVSTDSFTLTPALPPAIPVYPVPYLGLRGLTDALREGMITLSASLGCSETDLLSLGGGARTLLQLLLVLLGQLEVIGDLDNTHNMSYHGSTSGKMTI